LPLWTHSSTGSLAALAAGAAAALDAAGAALLAVELDPPDEQAARAKLTAAMPMNAVLR